jgi:hypothetical protein
VLRAADGRMLGSASGMEAVGREMRKVTVTGERIA